MRIFSSAAPSLVIFATLAVGCFPGGGNQHTIVGDYRLEQWEDGKTYYLHKRGQDDSSKGGSIIEGIVLKIGWSDRYIIAERHAFYRGDPDGWMVIDVSSGAITGPISEVDIRARSELGGIQVFDVVEAWRRM